MENPNTIDHLKSIAAQLACPSGEMGIKTIQLMNVNNMGMTHSTIDALDLQKHEQVLEIGPGNAAHLPYLMDKAENLHYHGADISQTAINEAKIINATFIEDEVAAFQLTDGQNLPFKNQVFSKIFTVNTIYFWNDVEAYLLEIKRVLNSDGRLALCFADKNFMEKLPFTPFGFQLYEENTVRNFLSSAGFKITNASSYTEKVQSNAGQWVDRTYHVLLAGN